MNAPDGLQRCFVLHRRPYSESSLILDIFSEEFGRITLMSKGARSKRSNLKGALQPFTPLLLKWSGKGAMKTLRQAEPISLGLPLTGINLYSALYVNELIGRVLMQEVSMPGLFHDYLFALTELAQADNPEPALRRFELALLAAMGYGVDFLHCAGTGEPIDPQMTYRYREQKGFIASVRRDNLTFLGNELIAISERRFLTKEQLQAAKRFTRIALKPYLGGKPLKSRELFIQMRIPRTRSMEK
ncbi:TPA: DNA repair protein RecO [Vibrio vulnificus]|uniref:DNA repair protein RecO n=2 Tax=Vibrio vulnificus TaxID=672 RepID=RECO_VIBVU|nr:DNA repair protein RecO [Vibrio vulnificus]Q8DC74.1 RecName: Full=DNA repair protein RecO; AltName: Full=Recombination protein O [Vibrio vulnificus CMCP6]AAO09991.1 DNA repair protein RecO [Vibrio vulnificus CMCP6]MCU8517932.1 DNA repair protein RecO [Vibrio vulnificus]QBN15036.1 DNA repair protein RecO [Vibrio vulnificus]WHE22753.1 DNA repair protein RecO [Vibrio vulnificus]HAS6204660.1 DNA repair protein RecO [Vibrio vulnificus]